MVTKLKEIVLAAEQLTSELEVMQDFDTSAGVELVGDPPTELVVTLSDPPQLSIAAVIDGKIHVVALSAANAKSLVDVVALVKYRVTCIRDRNRKNQAQRCAHYRGD